MSLTEEQLAILTLEEKRTLVDVRAKLLGQQPLAVSHLAPEEEGRILDFALALAGAPGVAAQPAPEDSNTGALVKLFTQQEQERRDPWRVNLKHYAAALARFEGHTVKHRQEEMLARAKNALITREDVMLLTFSLFGTGPTRDVYASIVLSVADLQDRVRHHNWYVAQSLGEQWVSQHGAAVDKLTEPLFPPVPAFAALNAKLLTEAGQSTVSGGAARYLEPSAAPKPGKKPAASGGAYPLQVVPDGQGGHVVDLQVVSDAYSRLQAQVAELTKSNAEMRAQLAARPAFGEKPASSDRGGRGRGGGRGAGRGRGASGGAEETSQGF
jgi:hypothetical protein